MKSPDAKFQSYLRREVETAGKRYEQAVEKVFALTEAPNIRPGLDLSDAILEVGQTLRVYTNALRSLANFAAREDQHLAKENPPHQPESVESLEGLLVHA